MVRRSALAAALASGALLAPLASPASATTTTVVAPTPCYTAYITVDSGKIPPASVSGSFNTDECLRRIAQAITLPPIYVDGSLKGILDKLKPPPDAEADR